MQPVTINRFPTFAAWCCVIARRLGYGEYETSVVAKLGEDYNQVLAVLEGLADRLTPEELNHRGYRLYEQFAPMVRTPGGQEAAPRFGQRGLFDPAKVERLLKQFTNPAS